MSTWRGDELRKPEGFDLCQSHLGSSLGLTEFHTTALFKMDM